MLTEAWTSLRYHPQQSRLWRTKSRFVGVAAGRGSGKTELSRRYIVRMLAVKRPWIDPLFFYALPTVAQAKRVAWNQILRLIPTAWLAKSPNISDMSVQTVFGSTLYVVGMDKPQRVEGNQYDGGVVDESCDQKPGAFARSLRPALSHRSGWCWRIGVPKRFGAGASEFKQFCEHPGDIGGSDESYAWSSEDILSADEIADARGRLDPRDYNEQYRASWETIGGGMFYAFTDALNLREVTYEPTLPLVIGCDFNVDPMCWVVCQVRSTGKVRAEELHVLDEFVVRNTNTPQTLDALFTKYGRHEAGFEFYGDASGRSRKTSAVTTDYLLIRNDARFKSRVFFPPANPVIADRVAACNAMFCNADGVARCLVNPRCKRLVADMSDRTWKSGTREPDDTGDLGHMSDALGYIIYKRFPVRLPSSGKSAAVHTS